MAVHDRQITTWLSKQVVYDYNAIQETSQGESAYVMLCIRPDERALLLACLNFYVGWADRWVNFPDIKTRDDLIARTNESIMTDMACSEDVADIIEQMALNGTYLLDIRDNLGSINTTLASELGDINTKLTSLEATIAALDQSALYDQLETILNGIGVILGAAGVSVAP